MAQRLRLVGIMLLIFGLVFFIGSGIAFMMYQDGKSSLQSVSEVQGAELSYNEDGQLIDRGETAAADEIMTVLKDEWGYRCPTVRWTRTTRWSTPRASTCTRWRRSSTTSSTARPT